MRKALEIDMFLDMLPLWIRRNIGILGFTVYTTFIWEKFLIYLLYFAIGVYVRKQMRIWDEVDKQSRQKSLALVRGGASSDKLNNSDMQHDYFERAKAIDYEELYREIRFTTPFLVYKIKKLWVVLDKISQSSFVIISVMIMVLSNYWQISLSMAIHLTCFISLCLVIASKLYQNRKKDKKKLKTKQKESAFDQARS